jgi:ferritin-like metal-binding protein YciE
MASVDSLDALLQEEIRDLYDAEKQLTRALPKMAKKATSSDLQAAFTAHLQQTQEQIGRLERVFEELDLPARGKKCVGMQYLIKEGEEMVSEAESPATRDAVLVAAAQKIEHYEIAGYGTARTWANVLGKSEVASLLEETLDEEKETDQKLTGIAEAFVNQAAASEDEEEEEERMPARGRTRTMSAGSGRSTRQQAADRGTRRKTAGRSRRSR